jgi:hypothetical protein
MVKGVFLPRCSQPCPKPLRQALHLHLCYKFSWVIIDFKYWNNILWMLPLQTTSALFLAIRMRALFTFRIAMTRLCDLSFGIHVMTSFVCSFFCLLRWGRPPVVFVFPFLTLFRHFRTYAVVHVPEDPAQVGMRLHVVNCMYVYTRDSSWNPDPNTPEPDRPHYDRPTSCVIAQQNVFATFVSLHFLAGKENFPRVSNNVIGCCCCFFFF